MLVMVGCNKAEAKNANEIAATTTTNTNNQAETKTIDEPTDNTDSGYQTEVKSTNEITNGDYEGYQADVIIRDNLYMTTVSDIYANLNSYEGKTIKVEGFTAENGILKFVARKGPACNCGRGDGGGIVPLLVDYSENIEMNKWIKVYGTIEKVILDDGYEYPSIKVEHLEYSDTWGQEAVTR